jgi:hypothetical protein
MKSPSPCRDHSAGVALFLLAAAFHVASTLGWGGAEASDGTRYKASPVGLSHVLQPRTPVSPTIDCAALAALSALVLFDVSIEKALAPLSGLAVSPGGTLGTMQLTAAILLCVATCTASPTRWVASPLAS